MLDVLIVGGGPAGLFLGALLAQQGVDVQVLERRRLEERSPHSRAIGIHPPSLAALERIGLAGPLVESGVRIRRGVARSQGRFVAGLHFGCLSGAYPFVLSLPQTRTEDLLRRRLEELRPGAVRYGLEVRDVEPAGGKVMAAAVAGSGGARRECAARYLIGADGARSTVRGALGITTRLKNHPDTYVMGDFADTTPDGSTAVLYLEPEGIVESFPLPGGVRRWVAWTPSLLEHPTAEGLARTVRRRTGVEIDAAGNTMLSAFAVRSRLAAAMAADRCFLIGDAAHEISPIGGQGMNLGWLDAVELAPLLVRALAGESVAFQHYERRRRLAARRAAVQAQVNMALGRPLRPALLQPRNLVLGRGLGTIFGDQLARAFSMAWAGVPTECRQPAAPE